MDTETETVRLPYEIERALRLTELQKAMLELGKAGLLEQFELLQQASAAQASAAQEQLEASQIKHEHHELVRRVESLQSELRSAKAEGRDRAIGGALAGGTAGYLIGALVTLALTPKPTIKSVIKDAVAGWLLG